MTLNTHSWMEANDQQQIEILAKRIVKEEYDLISLQEVNQLLASPLAKTDKYFQPTVEQQGIHQDNFLFCLTERLKELGCYYYWGWGYSHIGYDIYHEGIGLMSKVPIKVESRLISESSDPNDYHTRMIMIGESMEGDQKLIVVSGHFSWWRTSENAFAYEWRALENILLEKQGAMIIMGDFNNDAKRIDEGYDLVKESPLEIQDAFIQAKNKSGENTVEKSIDGWDQNAEELRIDYVFTSLDFEIESYRIVFDGKNEYTISDHYGIEVTMD
ncbi:MULTISPECIES: endonuclease/exonuclease/phosphatase family protein [Enterococcus]|uniref:endonuclease/exonuclease/phosphatase family protein n=1 Tax=Enterococcus TaxID=1350 RepID=UPI000EDC1237|nr:MULTISPECIES: endonuclease/exonuclease/phosphatase family protein [Enterococcus]HCM86926.1 hydrolase [Enterococcus sp.]